MARICAPNKKYTGVSASIAFANGVGYTDDPRLIKWFKSKGYTVEGESQVAPGKFGGMDVDALKKYAIDNNIDIGSSSSVRGIIKKITEAETARAGNIAPMSKLEDMDIDELKQYCIENDIDICDASNSNDIIAKISAVEKAHLGGE